MSSREVRREAQDLQFCWEEVQRTRPGFRVTLQFAPPERRQQLLGVYAWLSAIEQIVSFTSEPHIARTKLAWWQNEVLAGDPAGSSHPLLRAMGRAGALHSVPVELFAEEMQLASTRIERPTLPDMHALHRWTKSLGMNHLRIESALEGGGERGPGALSGPAAVNGLLQIVRECVRSKWLGTWWLPLELCARYGIHRDTGLGEGRSPNGQAALQDVWCAAQRWRTEPRTADRPAAYDHVRTRGLRSVPRHWSVFSQLQVLQLKQLCNHPAAFPRELIQPPRLVDVLRIWRFARRLGR